MGDLSAEPSMEDILASIKRVIKEGETQGAPRRMSPPRPVAVPPVAAAPVVDRDEEEVLELNQPLARPSPEPAPAAVRVEEPVVAAPLPVAQPLPSPSPSVAVSPATAEATRDALGALSRLIVKPEPGSDGTLEGMVRDMLRPMLGEWLDTHLPRLVEEMVAREIAKITNSPR